MKPTPEMLASVPFQYAYGVLDGSIVTGRLIKLAVQRFFRWIDEAPESGFYLDHAAGMSIIDFFPLCLNHTKGKMAGKAFHLAPFQQFTMYNVFAWKKQMGAVPDPDTDLRRIRTIYDKRAKKNGKSAEMAGLGLYMLSVEMEMEAEVYVGATKEDQARICWNQAKQFVESPVANRALKKMGFYSQQRIIGFHPTGSVMKPLGGDSQTQDGINAHLSIIDEYHAHKDDSVKENLESSAVQRTQPLIWHITTAGTNIQSACKRYEDSVVEVLEGRAEMDHIFIMIHDIDEEDDWEDENVWIKANPLLDQGLNIDRIREEYEKAKLQPSKIPNFKTKHLNMWVDAPTVWIMSDTWMRQSYRHNKDRKMTDAQVLEKFQKYGCYGGLDLSSTTDITAYALVSEPDDDGDRYVKVFFFCPKIGIDKRSKVDRVPYRFWADKGYIVATEGEVVDYNIVYDYIQVNHTLHKTIRIEIDEWNAANITTNLMDSGINVSYFSQSITKLSKPTKQFEKLVYEGKLWHDGNPVLAWMLAGCQIISDANENIKVHKGKSNTNGRRIDGIPAIINALGGSLSEPEDTNESIYNRDDVPFEC
ncbi:terminase large subunit [Flavobacterium sp. NRK1]|uniref:terminase large subunit n=1 Tax=Flavobacterium sp. NRK1 TaxID=2954929 RepID=UPI002092AAA2|nr:terminase TerL endonuclease subunit [Flavobacterium sp. NRK1]MCO6149076.1 terminase large subunit [Flavobacterium sp. NRK1]